MPFTVNNYLDQRFKNVGSDADSIRDAANAIIAAQNTASFWGAVGNSSPVEWAMEALRSLDDIRNPDSTDKTKFAWRDDSSPQEKNRLNARASAFTQDTVRAYNEKTGNSLDNTWRETEAARKALEGKQAQIQAYQQRGQTGSVQSATNELSALQTAYNQAQENQREAYDGYTAFKESSDNPSARNLRETVDSLQDLYDSKGMTESEYAADRAYQWITGSAQPTRAAKVLQRARESKTDIKKSLENEMSNAANTFDYSNLSPEEAITQFQKNSERADQYISSIEEKAKMASLLGMDDLVSQATGMIQNFTDIRSGTKDPSTGIAAGGVTRLASGYIPASEAAVGERTMREGEPTTVKFNPDTNAWEILGTRTGNLMEGGFGSIKDALGKQTERQSGSKPNEIGAFTADNGQKQPTESTSSASSDASAVDTMAGNEATGTSNILPDNIDLSGYSPEQIQEFEAAYLAAGDDKDLLTKMIGRLVISEEDITSFMQTAKDEFAPYYNQAFGRGVENFEKEMKFQSEERTRALELERIQREEQIRGTKAGLEATGMTSTGEAARQLGKESRFTDELLGTTVGEGLIPEQQRLLSSSAEARFAKGIEDFGRQTEDILGSAAIAGSDQSMFTATPGVRGSLEREKTTSEQLRAAELEKLARTRRTEIVAGEGGVSTF